MVEGYKENEETFPQTKAINMKSLKLQFAWITTLFTQRAKIKVLRKFAGKKEKTYLQV